jgi:simple sugar transport system substrate-binding protein
MEGFRKISRRNFVQGTVSAVGATLLSSPLMRAAAQDNLVVGFMALDNWNDYGYTQSHLAAANAVAGMDAVKVLKEEGVPEAVEAQKTMKSMIELTGASIIFATSWGYYDPHVLKVAAEYPNVHFFHCGGIWEDGHPENIATYFAYTDEPAYVSGVVAGRLAKTGKIGFVGSKPIPEIVRFVNGFTLGARSVNPQAQVQFVLTGDWTNPVREAEVANSLIDQGMEVIACDVDIPKVLVEICDKRGVFSTGMHVSQRELAPNTFLTGAEWNWGKACIDFVSAVRDGKSYQHNVRGGLADDLVKVSEFGNAVPDSVRQEADAVTAEIKNGSRQIYQGPIKDNTGNLVIPASEVLPISDVSLETVEWLVEGVIGTTS